MLGSSHKLLTDDSTILQHSIELDNLIDILCIDIKPHMIVFDIDSDISMYGQKFLKYYDLALDGDRYSQYRLGLLYQRKGEYLKGMYWYYQSLLRNSESYVESIPIQSVNNIGIAYVKGYFVVQNDYIALQWFHIANEMGSNLAKDNIAMLYCSSKDCRVRYNEVGFVLMKRLAQTGDKMALNNLALMYYFGIGHEVNVSKAWKYMKLAIKDNALNGASHNYNAMSGNTKSSLIRGRYKLITDSEMIVKEVPFNSEGVRLELMVFLRGFWSYTE